jgi:hypothetical protein
MKNNPGVKWLGLLFVCPLMSTWLWAQAGAAGSAPPPATPMGQGSEVTSSKPHDNSFVIGNDDVLTINVWCGPTARSRCL